MLVTNYTNKHFGFPRGKVNEGEDGVSCAIREVWEEIGIDITDYINEESSITFTNKKESKTMYVVIGVPENTKFNPNHITRKEIGKIEWTYLFDFEIQKDTDKFYGIKHFLPPLKMYIEKFKDKIAIDAANIGVSDRNLSKNESNERQKYLKVSSIFLIIKGQFYETSRRKNIKLWKKARRENGPDRLQVPKSKK